MRIGVEASYLLEPQKTGVEHYTASLTRALLELESPHEFLLYLNRPPAAGELESLLGRGRAEARVVPRRRFWLKLWLPRAAKRDGVEAMLFPGSIISTYHPFRCLPIIYDLCWAHYPHFYPRRERVIFSRVFPKSLSRAAGVIATSEQTKRDIAATYRYPEDRITVVLAGRDPVFQPVNDAPQTVKRKYGLDPGYIFAVGTSHPRKNIAGLLQACGQLLRRGRCPAVALAGTGEVEALREAVVGAGLKGRAQWLGYVKREDLPALFTACGAFVFPSFYEGFGLPVLEAMGCGAPVVCSRAGSLPEVAGEAALLVDPADTAALADAIERVLTDTRLANELSTRGKDRVLLFNWKQSAKTALAAVEQLK